MRNFKRCIAFILALITTVAIIPPIEVLANRQAPIPAGSLRLADTSLPGVATYNVQLIWDHPPISQEPDTSGVIPGHINAPHPTDDRPLYYDLEFRNATAGGGFAPIQGVANPLGPFSPPLSDPEHTPILNLGLASNSIYSFRVVPWHEHQFETVQQDGTIILETRRAQETANFRDTLSEVLYLTDITPNAEGRGGEIHVSLPNPTFEGRDVFWGFEIMFRRQDAPPGQRAISIGQIPMAEFTRTGFPS
jgi:hypothetical protein